MKIFQKIQMASEDVKSLLKTGVFYADGKVAATHDGALVHVGDPVGICTQILTSIDALETITDTTSHCYDRETTLVKKGWQVFHTIREDSADAQRRPYVGRNPLPQF